MEKWRRGFDERLLLYLPNSLANKGKRAGLIHCLIRPLIVILTLFGIGCQQTMKTTSLFRPDPFRIQSRVSHESVFGSRDLHCCRIRIPNWYEGRVTVNRPFYWQPPPPKKRPTLLAKEILVWNSLMLDSKALDTRSLMLMLTMAKTTAWCHEDRSCDTVRSKRKNLDF